MKVKIMKKVKVIQFGEGKFLRAFVDVVLQQANNKLGYPKYSVDIIQPLASGNLMQSLEAQDFKYVVNEVNPALGVDNPVRVNCITNGIDPYTQFDDYKSLATDPDAEYVFSNTTESGITYVSEQFQTERIMESFPGKVMQLLYIRYQALGADSTLTFVPCELIEENAQKLRSIVVRKAVEANLNAAFIAYIENCDFYTSLVDRIVVGYQDNKFEDPNYILCEPFMKWVIDSPQLEFAKDANLETIIFDDVKVHRELKVKVLNGLHTALTPFAILGEAEYVHEIFESNFMCDKVEKLLSEILATIHLENKHAYAETIIDRFKNPKLNHKFSDIMLNSLDKYQTRDYPAVIQNLQMGKMPTELLSSLAAIVVQYKCGFPINDGGNVELWSALNLDDPASTLVEYKFTELKAYPDALTYINKTVSELQVKYEKNN